MSEANIVNVVFSLMWIQLHFIGERERDNILLSSGKCQEANVFTKIQ